MYGITKALGVRVKAMLLPSHRHQSAAANLCLLMLQVGKAVSHFEGELKKVEIRLSVSGGERSHGKKQQRTEITVYTLRNGIFRAEDVEDNM